jgi:hypothetical protein
VGTMMHFIGYNLKMAAFVALFGFSIYLIKREKDESARNKLYVIQAIIMFAYFAGKLIEDM